MKCKNIFGHKWRYYFGGIYINSKIDIRACRRCHTVQYWAKMPVNHYAWITFVQFTEKGAKADSPGYGIDTTEVTP
jgi:hypothetical protein